MSFLPTQIPTSLEDLNPFAETSTGSEAAPSLTIRELTGRKRSIQLSQRALPLRADGIEFGGETRRKTTWYMGNPVATQQVLGPKLDNTTVNGVWNDLFIRGTTTVDGFDQKDVFYARDLVKYFRDMQTAGQELEVSWGPESRRGLLVRFTPRYERLQDILWEMEFEWRAATSSPVKFVSVPEPLRPSAFTELMNKVSEVYALGPENVFPDVNAILVSSIADLRREVSKIFGILRTTQKIASVPAEVVGAFSTAVASIRLELLSEMTRLAETPVNNVTTYKNATNTLESETWRRDMSAALDQILGFAAQVEETLKERSEPAPNQTFTAGTQTTLYAISLEFYDTPDFAVFLREANFLESMDVPVGTTVLIPPKPTGLTP